ncbi:uncharacterized protein A1O9_12581 [Exophiala aquamarina CBS 119918]|uniref:Acyl-CoA dehydrogenase n=1 Tax=Exophiala aquamarina CBS 119918 TaxID=1182545 RepID=A0A072NVL0_9EURO|nr:uncharacterized protein A1O9_12581 [Exophiala aquamarina CBS 119918]KEF51432.1 hypothetical protein A1O9_12581 [Exophiala aquamarina CBS 119918]
MAEISEEIRRDWVYGSTIPYAEASWARGLPSPFYNDSHRCLRQAMRDWVEKNVMPFAQDWDDAQSIPPEVYEAAARDGVLMPMAAGSRIPEEWCGKYPIIGGVKPEEWDGFHDLILHDEFGRAGGIGYVHLPLIAFPVLQRFGSEEIRSRIVDEILRGKKRVVLAITEPNAGSDVQGISTEMEESPNAGNFIVNGQKKWITGGMYADYFLTLVKDPAGGQTLLVIPRQDGLTTKHMRMSGSGAAGTAFVEFDDVQVPVRNVIGQRGQAFKYIVTNFNHERLFIAFQALRCARVCLEDAIEYALSRETFGKKLMDHPVVRFKIAHMSRETEALQSWVENTVYQAKALSPKEADFLLSGPTAQLKAHSGIVLERVTREAIQIMGGIGLTRGGRGERVERIWRDVKAITVPGGSEEILLDLSVRRAVLAQKVLSAPATKL